MKQITSFLHQWHTLKKTCTKNLNMLSCTSDMLSRTNFFLVHISCTKQNAALFRASLYKNLYELESNSDFVQVSCISFWYKFLECVSGILLTGV